MITSFEGVMGSGKTLTAVALACSEHFQNGKRVISNIHLNFPYIKFDMRYFLEHVQDEQLSNCVTLLDEAHQYMDARRSGGKGNLLWTYYTVQTRKRDVDLFACFHHVDVMDKRFRRQIDIRGTCRYSKEDPCSKCGGEKVLKRGNQECPVCAGTGRLEDDTCPRCRGIGEVCPRCLGYGVTGWATTRFLDLRNGKRNRIRVFGPAFYGMYSTEELIPFTGKQLRISVDDL